MGFNPCRVFKSAATSKEWIRIVGNNQFQSLSGFQVRCNQLEKCYGIPYILSFNPCRVFKSAATICSYRCPLNIDEFQSLSGFQVRCNNSRQVSAIPVAICFNPCRVFKSAATSIRVYRRYEACMVSIPVGFSSPLQRCMCREVTKMTTEFQSLSGFQVRCNTYDLRRFP